MEKCFECKDYVLSFAFSRELGVSIKVEGGLLI